MWDWLLSSIDPTRTHDVGFAVSWHARMMVLGWGVLAPLAVFAARFFKVMPGQDWPRELDNQVWWRSHWMGQLCVLGLSAIGFILVLPADFSQMSLHRWLGYSVLLGLLVQLGLGFFRGSKGGPTAPAEDGSLRGHHYDMTPWRRTFENVHKATGYALLLLACVTIFYGLWEANAPKWMLAVIVFWWVTLVCLFGLLQKRGMAVDTYQAIWGKAATHPGNQRPAPKWGVHRPGDALDE